MPRPSARRRSLAPVVGALLAIAVTDLALRPFASGLPPRWHLRPLSDDAIEGPIVEVRQYHEGIARSHFSSVHARLTGSPLPAAPTIGVLLGDSYVEAIQVSDSETTGAVVEHLAGRSGMSLQVRQYGWSGASLAQYVRVAPQVLARWNPAWVAVMVNSGDLTPDAVAAAAFPYPPSDDSIPAASPVGVRGRAVEAGRWLLERSPLANELVLSALELRPAASTTSAGVDVTAPSASAALAPGVVTRLRELREAYGSRLLLLYVGQIPAQPSVTVDSLERAFLAACVLSAVRCVGTADAMREERDRHASLSRGFTNGMPGNGHPNATGHRVLGAALWRAVADAGRR